MLLVFSLELCRPHPQPCLEAVAFCLKCRVRCSSQQRPSSRGGFVLTHVSDESRRRRGPLRAGSRAATWRPAQMYSAPLFIHFRAGAELLREWMSQSKPRSLSGWCFLFLFFFLSCQSRNKCLESNRIRISFYTSLV